MQEKRVERRGLGRGLSALMADVSPAMTPAVDQADAPRADRTIPIERIAPNPDQPRRSFDEASLQDLAASIREKGILQPLILRPDPAEDGRYQIVAGERRWRAAQLAQLHAVPAIVRTLDDTEVLEIAIIENVQRADLNAAEEAAGYQQLIDRFGHTQEQVADALGKSRSHVANTLRLLRLPADILDMLRGGTISAGHARALLTADDPLGLARRIVSQGLNVRETERLAKAPREGKPTSRPPRTKDADTRMLERDLYAALRMKVSIDHGTDGGGRITVSYRSLDQLDEVCRRLTMERDPFET
jgi:ParB family chromosome partitioning protein